MKKNLSLILLFLCINVYSLGKLRLYDQVLGISDYMEDVVTYKTNSYESFIWESSLLPSEAYASYLSLYEASLDKSIPATAVSLCKLLGRGTNLDIKGALKILTSLKDEGFVPSMDILGQYYLNTGDYARAISLFNQAANFNYKSSLYHLSQCYEKGLGCNKDLQKAELLLLKIKSLKLSPTIYYDLGEFYTTYNPSKARGAFLEGAENEDNRCKNILVTRYGREGVYKNYKKEALAFFSKEDRHKEDYLREAFKTYNLSTEDKDLLYDISQYYKESVLHRDIKKYLSFLHKASERGNPRAQYEEALLYYQGLYVPKNYTKAFDLFKSSSSCPFYNPTKYMREIAIGSLKATGFMNRYNAMVSSSTIYSYDFINESTYLDEKKAYEYLSSFKDKESKAIISYASYYGRGCNKKNKKEMALLLEDPDLLNIQTLFPIDDNDESSSSLRLKTMSSIESFRKEEKALQDLAAKGNRDSLESYGKMLLNKGDLDSIKKALFYFVEASRAGSSKSMNHAGFIYEQGLVGEANPQKAVEYYLDGVDRHNVDCLNSLARLYETGLLMDFDLDKAIDLYTESALRGNKDALLVLASYGVHIDPKDIDTFDYDSYTYGSFVFEKEESAYKDDLEGSIVLQMSLNELEELTSLDKSKIYRIVLQDELDNYNICDLYNFFTSEAVEGFTLDLDLSRSHLSSEFNGQLPDNAIGGTFRKLYLPEVDYIDDNAVGFTCRTLVFPPNLKVTGSFTGSGIKEFDFNKIKEEDFQWPLIESILRINENGVKILCPYKILTFKKVLDYNNVQELRKKIDSTPEKLILDLRPSSYPRTSKGYLPLPKAFLCKHPNLYHLVLGDMEGLNICENMLRDDLNLQTIMVYNYGKIEEGAFIGVKGNAIVVDNYGNEYFLRKILK